MKRFLMLAMLLTLVGATAGCGDDDDADTAQSALVRVAHLSPDAPNVDVRVDGTRILANVPFLAVSDYLELAAGSHRIQVTPANATSPVVIDANVTVAGGKAYTVAATGLLAAIQPLVLEDDRTPAGGQARVRFVHASPDAPAVDVVVRGGPTLFPNVPFRGSAGYAAVAPASYDLDVRVAGTNVVALPVDAAAVAAGLNYTIFAVGLAGNGTLAALPVVDYQP